MPLPGGASTALLNAPAPPGRPVRLLGLTVSNFASADAQSRQLALPLEVMHAN
jgi:hypothetical protein